MLVPQDFNNFKRRIRQTDAANAKTYLEHRGLLRKSMPRPLCSPQRTHTCPRPTQGSAGSAKNLEKHRCIISKMDIFLNI